MTRREFMDSFDFGDFVTCEEWVDEGLPSAELAGLFSQYWMARDGETYYYDEEDWLNA